MPKRKIKNALDLVPPSDPAAALAAIRESLAHPLPTTEAEKKARLAHRPHVERHEFVVTERRGKQVYREPGKGGADLPVPPYVMQMLKAQRDFETACAKADRMLALKPRHQLKANERAARILELATTIAGHGRIKAIARAAPCSVRTVQRVLEKHATSKVTDSK